MAEEKRNFEIKLKHVPVSFVKVFKAEAFRGAKRGPSEDSGQKSYSINALISKTTEAGKDLYDKVQDLIDDAMDAEWGSNKPRLKPDKFCLKDGDDEEYEGYKDHWYISARSSTRPKVIDADGKTPLAEEDGRPYSGSVCNVWIRIWVQDNEYGKRVNASLEAVQFVKDGPRFAGAAPIPDEEFEDERDPKERSSRRSRSDDEERPSRRSRSDDDDRSSRRGRDADDERPARSRRDDDDRGSRSSRDSDDRRSSRRRDDDEAPARRRGI